MSHATGVGPLRKAVLLGVATLLVVAGVAFAAGLSNSSFEDGLDGWTAQSVRDDGYNPAEVLETGENCGSVDGVCVVEGQDSFTVRDGAYDRAITVTPNDGNKMARLGGPFPNSETRQRENVGQRVSQSFTVDPTTPVLQLSFNVFTFDYEGFDSLNFSVRLTDEDGNEITRFEQGAFGSGGDTSFKTTGWQPAYIDLTGYENQQVHLRITSKGTQDDLYGFWSYVDAGLVTQKPVGTPAPGSVSTPGPNSQPVPIKLFGDSGTGKSFITIPYTGGVNEFPAGTDGGQSFDHCLDLPLSVPINPGTNGGVVSNVKLILNPKKLDGTPDGPDRLFPMTQGAGNLWNGTIKCVQRGELLVQYDLTEAGSSQQFIVPIGGLALIDPQGVVYDKSVYDGAVAGGQTDGQARSAGAINGATVRLQRSNAGVFANVLSGDPGISPNLNPEITQSDGKFQWDVAAGTYRVVVTKTGYATVTSPGYEIPPPKLDAHVAMVPAGGGTGGGGTGGGGSGSAAPLPKVPASVTIQAIKKACAGLSGKAKAKCALAVKISSKCGAKKGKKKTVCAARIRALEKCNAIKTNTKKGKRKKAACVRKANAIGKPKKKSKSKKKPTRGE